MSADRSSGVTASQRAYLELAEWGFSFADTDLPPQRGHRWPTHHACERRGWVKVDLSGYPYSVELTDAGRAALAGRATAWRTYSIQVDGFPSYVMSAPSRAKARIESFQSYRECRHGVRFRDFIKLCRVVVCDPPADDGYDYVRRNYGVDPKIGQWVTLKNEGPSSGKGGVVTYPGLSTASVHVAMDGDDFTVRVHPMNVVLEPIGLTPAAAA